MKKIVLHETFMQDILNHGDPNFARRVLQSLYDEANGVVNNNNDHRYHGIDNAWIRYLSRGKTAYRIIYISQAGKKVFYRCGNHNVEDNLAGPSGGESVVELVIDGKKVEESHGKLGFLTNHNRPILYACLLGRRMIPHERVFIVSPFIDPGHLLRTAKLGQVLDSIRSGGTDVHIITSLDRVKDFEKVWKDLDARGIDIVFLERLHSKIYLFKTNKEHHDWRSSSPSLGIVGSSNLTKKGVSEVEKQGNYEANYAVSEEAIGELERMVEHYYYDAHEYRRAVKLLKQR